MDERQREQIAAFRYSLIAPIVSKQAPLAHGELTAYLQKMAEGTYTLPGTSRQHVSVRSLERYLSLYRQGGWDALKPLPRKDKGRAFLSEAVVEKAIALRKERPDRSVAQILYLLE